LSERSDGSGVVELPILSEQGTIDLSRTASGRSGEDAVTAADLADAVRNFSEWPGPVPIHTAPHRSMSETAGPGDGFVDKLFVRGSQLWAQLDLTAPLFQEVKSRRWRGFSVDYGRGAKLATKTIKGFVVAGGVFTNRPASDVHFKVAANSEIEADLMTIFMPFVASGAHMPEDNKDITVSLATAEAKAQSAEEKVVKLEAKLVDERSAREKAETRADAAEKTLRETGTEAQMARLSLSTKAGEIKDLEDQVTSLEATNKDLRVKLATQVNETIGQKVTSLCVSAIKQGVAPAKIKQFGDYEKDPVKLLNSNFGGSLDSLELVLKSFPREAALRAVNSGHEIPGDDDSAAVTPAVAAELRRRGLDPKYANLSNSDELTGLKKS